MSKLIVVTGSFGYLGAHITEELLKRGFRVRTLTGHPNRPNPFGGKIEVVPFEWDAPGKLVEKLEGAHALINTYWVRFSRRATTYERAVANTQNLIRAAAEASLPRFVHTSITQPSVETSLGYFRGKAIMEETLTRSGLSYGIMRPTVFFGGRDILLNNITWMLRRLPVFGVFGDGTYRIQPVHVDDAAKLAVDLAIGDDNVICDAVGPETYTFADLVRLLAKSAGVRRPIVEMSPALGWFFGRIFGWMVRDVVITRDEITGLMQDLLVSNDPPTCSTRLSEWLEEHGTELGRRWASELARHYRASAPQQPQHADQEAEVG